MRAWYKTKEGPVEATARMRDVVADVAALQPGNVRMLHAEVTARPGCTLLSVDVGALIDEDAESIAESERDDDGDETGSERARDEEIARALLDAGVRNSLDGVLDFEITNGAPSEVRTEARELASRSYMNKSAFFGPRPATKFMSTERQKRTGSTYLLCSDINKRSNTSSIM